MMSHLGGTQALMGHDGAQISNYTLNSLTEVEKNPILVLSEARAGMRQPIFTLAETRPPIPHSC